MTASPIFSRGLAPDGRPLIAGAWRMSERHGFPLELFHLEARSRGLLVDWCEAIADATRTHNAPALFQQLQCFLDSATLHTLRHRAVACGTLAP